MISDTVVQNSDAEYQVSDLPASWPMLFYPPNPPLLGHSDRRTGPALYSRRWTQWRRWLTAYTPFASLVSSIGSAIATYRTNAALSLAFAIISAIASAVQLTISKDVSKLVDPEERPLVSATVGTPLVHVSPLNPLHAARPTSARHSPPSGLPVVNHEFLSAEGGNRASLEPDNDWNGRDAPGVLGPSSFPSPSSGLPVAEEEPEHVEQIVPTNHESPYAPGGSQASLGSENDLTDWSGADSGRITSLSSSPPSDLMDGDLDHAKQIVSTNHKVPFARRNKASFPTHRKHVAWSTHKNYYAPLDPIFDASERAGYSTGILTRTSSSSSRMSQRNRRNSSSQGHVGHDYTSASESDWSDADDSEYRES
ncbi:hypothetical protein FB446DRAFT_776505 [Lentinula raphanica]|nr:hypothetical protein FB446DRAFT_776505 [Lentinula raphanica]